MRKTKVIENALKFIWILTVFSFLAGCSFIPPDISPIEKSSAKDNATELSPREELALLKANTNHTVDIDILEQMVNPASVGIRDYSYNTYIFAPYPN